MSERKRNRIVVAERARRISLFGATLIGAALGGFVYAPSVLWVVLIAIGIAMNLHAAKLKQPGDDALLMETCEARTSGEIAMFSIGVFVLSGALVGAVLWPSLLWIAVGLGGVAMTIRYQVRRAHVIG